MLFSNVARLKIGVIIHYISRPVRLVLGNSQIQPWLVVSVVMNDSCIVYLCLIKSWVIAKSQDMPTPVQRIGQVVESDKSRRQGPKFPKSSILILQNNYTLVASLSREQYQCITSILHTFGYHHHNICIHNFKAKSNYHK